MWKAIVNDEVIISDDGVESFWMRLNAWIEAYGIDPATVYIEGPGLK